jgi:cellulose synthase (UDP-forming)
VPRRSGVGRVLEAVGGALVGGAGLVVLALVVMTPLGLRTQALLGAALFGVALVLARLRQRTATLALVLVSLTVSARYLFWRLTTTVDARFTLDTALGALLLAAELHSFTMLVLGYLQSMATLPRRPAPLPPDTRGWPSVDVYIPTYNEPLDVVRATVMAARALDWPAEKLNVFLLDDGRRDAFRAFAATAGVGYLVRPDNRHAKAGNLNHALTRTRGELVAIFDCDHVPTRSFLQLTVGWFLRDPRLAFVQTPHHFYSPDPFERNLRSFRRVPNEGELFYGLIQPGNDLWNAAFFCGSCAVLRRTALAEVGGIAVETVTEDAHTALRMHRRGWHTAYLDIPQAGGLATESLSAHVGQRIRWARGMAQIFRIDNPLLGRGLSTMQRLCYAASMLSFFSGLPRLVFLVAPLSYLVFDLHVFNALPLVALAYGLPHLAHTTVTNSRVQGGFRHSFWSEVYEVALAWYIAVPTTVALFSPQSGSFNVTAKGGKVEADHFEQRIARPYLVLAGLNLVALAVGLGRLATRHGATDVLAINILWSGQNLVVLAATLAVAFETRQRRECPRVAVRLPAMIRLDTGQTVRCQTADLSRSGGRLVAPPGRTFSRGQRIWVSLFSVGDEVPLDAEVVAHDGAALRVKFVDLSLAQESCLVQAIFSRANAWTRWRDGRAKDRPLLALATIARHALGGARGVLGTWRPAPRPASDPALPFAKSSP